MKRTLHILIITGALLVGFALPASAHVIEVHTPNGEVHTHRGEASQVFGWAWVGGVAADAAQGTALLESPAGKLPPAHAGGLVTACETIRANDKAAVDIYGPPNELTCTHG